jgi:probable rRNA maturation factor
MKPMRINLHNQTSQEIKEIKKLLLDLFKSIDDKLSMEIILVDNFMIKNLNKTYRNIDKITDVLSFPNDDKDIKSLGDVFISVEKAYEQSIDLNHSFDREIGFLAVHGYLHLKGYDHHHEEDEAIMVKLQEEILEKANLKRS